MRTSRSVLMGLLYVIDVVIVGVYAHVNTREMPSLGLAVSAAEAGEIVPPHHSLGGSLHARHVQRMTHAPRPARLQDAGCECIGMGCVWGGRMNVYIYIRIYKGHTRGKYMHTFKTAHHTPCLPPARDEAVHVLALPRGEARVEPRRVHGGHLQDPHLIH